VLLGAPVTADGRPGPALARRLRCALDLLRAHPCALLLATGGTPPRAPHHRPEALVAADALAGADIAPARILVETSARNTWQNAAHSARLLRGQGLERRPVLLVTDPWHLPRALLAFRAHGISARGAGCRVAPAERPPALPRLLLHEGIGLVVYALRWLLRAAWRALARRGDA
jgi:uncharacterized SAM-binding protein YcdF (DUF218 family)